MVKKVMLTMRVLIEEQGLAKIYSKALRKPFILKASNQYKNDSDFL